MVQASQAAISRLKKDYQRLLKEPVPFMRAAPLPYNILEWHYIIFGAPNTPTKVRDVHESGIYHGKLVFPADFPFKPPSIYMLTPSGRFQTNTRLCLSISDFHPDTWNPAWTVSTIITGLLSFMNDTAPTLGSITSRDSEKKQLSRKSKTFNVKSKIFCELFEDVAEEIKAEMKAVEEAAAAAASSPDGASSEEERRIRSERDPESIGGGLSSFATNLLVLAGVVLVAFAVRYVIISAQQQDPNFK